MLAIYGFHSVKKFGKNFIHKNCNFELFCLLIKDVLCTEKTKTKGAVFEILVPLCDQTSFGRSKMVLVWPNLFGLDHNDLVMTKMKWSQPKWNGHVKNELVRSKLWFILVENHNLDLTKSFWSWPFQFGQEQIIMVKSKSIWSDQNNFGPTKTVLVT